ncbi:DedA family protein [Cellulomonas sp. URHD0024]|uniref:DedA family protein n=1 Tax=Cellulomonas sp. URHD0024 TaxID=1302620 RepID=UPI00040DB26B|nr:DedA family protein [Cellulomonas sp. URHD0024]
MLDSFTSWLQTVPAGVVYSVIFTLVFAEDALFFGFVLPGETVVIVGGVLASQGRIELTVLIPVVVLAAILGDSVGYEVGKHVGPRLFSSRFLRDRQRAVQAGQEMLVRRGRAAVFLGRFTAFFRAMMPAMAGASRMPYAQFLPANAVGGLVWGAGTVLLGYFVGTAYERVAAQIGRGLAVAVVIAAIVALVVWRVRRRRAERAAAEGSAE